MYKGLIIPPFIVMKRIQSITIKDTIISLTDRNLIIIGNNGSGKTYVLDNIYSEIQKLVKDSDYLDKEIRIKRNNILKELENIYKNFIYILDLDKVELEKLKNNINSTSDIEFSIELKSLLQSINNKHNIFLENYKSFLSSQVTDIYTEFDPKPEIKSSYKKKYYYENKNQLNFYLKDLNRKISKFINSTISLKLNIDYNKQHKSPNFVVNFFNAKRTTNTDSQENLSNISIYTNFDNLFEKYLTDQFKSNLPIKENIIDEDFEYIEIKNNWLSKIENDLKYIFEEEETKISFDKIQNKILIFSGEKTYRLDSLSSGLQSIFKIYSSLLLRTKIMQIDPEDLLGIVIIDEIDVHLHISLQKKVLPFLIKAFPRVQFIVSTHSPFVITSTNNDTVVYDISSGEFFEEDLSRYSYESVIKGLFHVNPMSFEIKKSVETLKKLLDENPINYDSIRSNIKDLISLDKNGQLDKKVKNLYLQAINLLADHNQLEGLDV